MRPAIAVGTTVGFAASLWCSQPVASQSFAPGPEWRVPGAQRCYVLTGNFSCTVTRPPPPRLRPFVYTPPANQQPTPTVSDLQGGYKFLADALPAGADPAWLASMRSIPASYQELTQRIDQLGRDLTALRVADYQAEKRVADEIASAGEIHKTLLIELDEYRAELPKLAKEVAYDRASEAKYQRTLARISAEVDALASIQARAERQLYAERSAVIAWLFAFSPVPQRISRWDSLEGLAGGSGDISIPRLPLVVPPAAQTPWPYAIGAAPREGTPQPTLPDFKPAWSPGPSPREAMQTLYTIAGQVRTMDASLFKYEQQLSQVNAVNKPLIDRCNALERERALDQRVIDEYHTKLPAFHAGWTNMQNTWTRARDNAALRVVEAYVWNVWKEKVVKPAVFEAIAQAGNSRVRAELGESLTDVKVEALYRGGKEALEASGFNRFKRFLTVENDTLDMLHQSLQLIQRAPEIIAFASPEETEAFVRENTAFMDASGERLQRDAGFSTASRLQSNILKIARKLHLIEDE